MKTKNIIIAVAALAMLTSGLSFAQPAKPAGQPKMVIKEAVKDFGAVPKGEALLWNFEVRNDGTSDLLIDNVKPSCGCTVADYDKVVKPGGTGKIGLKVETKNFAGPISKSATVTSNDPSNPNMTLVIKATVKPYVDVLPQSYVRFSGLEGETSVQSVTLVTEEKTPFLVEKVESPQGYLSATVKKLTANEKTPGKGDNDQYRIDISLGEGAPVGLLNEKVYAYTNLEKAKKVEITVSGLVRPIISVTPQKLNFGTIAPGSEPTTRNVIVSNNKAEKGGFKVTSAEVIGADGASLGHISTEISTIQDGARYQVILKTKDGITKGPLNAKLKIGTNDQSNPTFEVDIVGSVQ